MPSEQLQAIIEVMRQMRAQRREHDIPTQRANMDRVTDIFPVPTGVTYAPVDAGGVPAEWAVPDDATASTVLLYFHGGAYVTGSPRSHRGLVGRLALATGARALSVDYRLAPEHPYPAAVQDAVTAYRWLVAQGVSPAHIAVSGDSAGGGLTLALLVALRDAGDSLPACAAPISPWTDMTGRGASWQTRLDLDPMLGGELIEESAERYLAGADPLSPTASPVEADLTGLPPILIQVGDWEVLLDDSVLFAERARAAGVEIELEVFAECIHVFQIFAGTVPESDEAVEKMGAWLRERLGG